MRKLFCSDTNRLGLYLALWCLGQTNLPANPGEDAQALLDRTIKVNRPWLDPRPIHGSYYLSRQPAGSDTIKKTGPFNLADRRDGSFYAPAYTNVIRVGSLVWTPLHHIAHRTMPYVATLAGSTNWNGTLLMAIDIAFDQRVKDHIGLGGQANTSYCETEYSVETARILIEPTQAIPRFIETHTLSTNRVQCNVTWVFDADFFVVDGGFAPRAFEWNDCSNFRERQEFQLFNKEWIFKLGQAWWGENGLGQTGLILSMALVDLEIPFPKLTLQASAGSLVLSWPTYGRAGIVLESAPSPQGPWSVVLDQISSDITQVTVTLINTEPLQLYRLRK